MRRAACVTVYCILIFILWAEASPCPVGSYNLLPTTPAASLEWNGTCNTVDVTIHGTQLTITSGLRWNIACNMELANFNMDIQTPPEQPFMIAVGGNATLSGPGTILFHNLKLYVAGSLCIDQQVTFDGSGRGYKGGSGTLPALCFVGCTFNGSSAVGHGANGGSHATAGGTSPQNAAPSNLYDSESDVNVGHIVHPGCGGGAFILDQGAFNGGDGGGALMLYADTIDFDGTITVDGTAGPAMTAAGAGAGGGVVLSYNRFVPGRCAAIDASGAPSVNDGVLAGGGGAGGVVYLSGDIDGLSIYKNGGTGNPGVGGGDGVCKKLSTPFNTAMVGFPTCSASTCSFPPAPPPSSGEGTGSATSATSTTGGSSSGASSSTTSTASSATTSSTVTSASSGASSQGSSGPTTSTSTTASSGGSMSSTTMTDSGSSLTSAAASGTLGTADAIVNGGTSPAASPFPAALVGGIFAALLVLALVIVAVVVLKRRRGQSGVAKDGRDDDDSNLMSSSAGHVTDSRRGGSSDPPTTTATLVGMETVSMDSVERKAELRADGAFEPTQRTSLQTVATEDAIGHEDTIRAPAPAPPAEPTHRVALSVHETTQRVSVLQGAENTHRAVLSGHETTQRTSLMVPEATMRADISGHEMTQRSSLMSAPDPDMRNRRESLLATGDIATRVFTNPAAVRESLEPNGEATQRAPLTGHEDTQRGSRLRVSSDTDAAPTIRRNEEDRSSMSTVKLLHDEETTQRSHI